MLMLKEQSKRIQTSVLNAAEKKVLVWLAACVVTYLTYPIVARIMATISPGFEPAGPGLLMLSSFVLCLLFSLIHIWLIRSKIRH